MKREEEGKRPYSTGNPYYLGLWKPNAGGKDIYIVLFVLYDTDIVLSRMWNELPLLLHILESELSASLNYYEWKKQRQLMIFFHVLFLAIHT